MAKTYGGVRYSHSKPSSDFKEFRAFSRDWEKTYFDHDTGGFVVTHHDRIESGNRNKQSKEVFEKEQEMCHDLAEQGHRLEHRSDKDRAKGDTYDVMYDGRKADLKSTKSHNNIEGYAEHAFRDQGAKVVIYRIEPGAQKDKVQKALNSAKNKYGQTILYYYQSEKILREV
ncbi:MAG: hypothetical protein HDS33_03015 [Bacteroides sp.]|nr:hypothetical protein [Bacteroides sp.]